jgi:hypothetical protein
MHEHHYADVAECIPQIPWTLDADFTLASLIATFRLPLRLIGFDTDHAEIGMATFVFDVHRVVNMYDPVDLNPSQSRLFVNDVVINFLKKTAESLTSSMGLVDSALLLLYANPSSTRYLLSHRLPQEQTAKTMRAIQGRKNEMTYRRFIEECGTLTSRVPAIYLLIFSSSLFQSFHSAALTDLFRS